MAGVVTKYALLFCVCLSGARAAAAEAVLG